MHSKGNYEENEKATHRMGENICNLRGQQEINLQGIQKAYVANYKKNNTNIPTKKWAEDLNRHFSKQDRQMAPKHLEHMSFYM